MELTMWFIIVPLAAWRLTVLIHQDKIAAPIRRLFGEVVTEGIIWYPSTFLGELIQCFRCVSVWTSLITLGIYFLFPLLLLPLALSGAVMLIESKAG